MNRLRTLRDKLLAKIWYSQFKDWRHFRALRRVRTLTPAQKTARGITRTVRIVANYPGMAARNVVSTPGGSCQWGSTLFVPEGEADLYFIINSLRRAVPGRGLQHAVALPGPERAWALHMEPEEYVHQLGYDDPAEHALFSRFYTNCATMLAAGGRYVPAPPYVHNHLGKTWDFLEKARPMRKKISLGLIMSGLKKIEGHRARFVFLEALERSGLDYAFWGRGENLESFRGYRGFAGSKWNVHAACRYSIVLENTVAPEYWSEKPVDALLAWSLPIYHGAPNFGDYVPEESFVRIDIAKPDEAISTLRRVVAEDPYEQRLPAMAEARRRLQHEHHLYAFIDREMAAHFHAGS